MDLNLPGIRRIHGQLDPVRELGVLLAVADFVCLLAGGAAAVARQPLNGDGEGLRARDRHVRGRVGSGSLHVKLSANHNRGHVRRDDAFVDAVVVLAQSFQGQLPVVHTMSPTWQSTSIHLL